MGLLDDAIKEHLDLKRRRGADPAEVERAEREALGPVRRTPSSAGAEVGEQPQAESDFDSDHRDDHDSWTDDSPAEHVGGDHAFETEAGLEDPESQEPEPEPPRPAKPSRFARIFGRADPEPDHEEPGDYEHDEPARLRPNRAGDPLDEPEAFAPSPAPEPVPPPVRAARPLGRPAGSGETAEYDVESALGGAGHAPAAKQDDGEDVLEETPEFLQDTPDHDRLWFEQRPPRDFDFDG